MVAVSEVVRQMSFTLGKEDIFKALRNDGVRTAFKLDEGESDIEVKINIVHKDFVEACIDIVKDLSDTGIDEDYYKAMRLHLCTELGKFFGIGE